MPHDHAHVLADVHQGGAEHVALAADAAAEAWRDWSRWPWEERASVFLRAAELLAGPWRDTLNAATMLGQSKTAHQAEIDAACELVDFLRFNVEFMTRIYAEQPRSSPGVLEPARVPAARGLRLRRLALQLHRHRRQPAELGRADGERRRLEARLDRDAERLLPDAALPGGRPARRRHQPRLRLGRGDRRRRARAPRPRRHPLHRLDRRLQRDVGHGRRRTSAATATTRASSARRAARTSSSPTPPPTSTRSRPRSCAARSSTRARSARPPRASTRPRTSGRRCASGSPRRSATIKVGDVADFRNFMGAVIDASSFATQRAGDRRGARPRRDGDRRRRRLRRLDRLLRRAHRDRDARSRLPAAPRRALRPGRDRPTSTTSTASTRRSTSSTRDATYGLTGAVFAEDRAAVAQRQRAAALRRRQLLRQRQADRRRRRPAALRRRPRARARTTRRARSGT